MNTHKNARLTFIRRVEMIDDVLKNRLPSAQAAVCHGVSETRCANGSGAFLSKGARLSDRSSRPAKSPHAIASAKALTIIELRKKRMTQARLAE